VFNRPIRRLRVAVPSIAITILFSFFLLAPLGYCRSEMPVEGVRSLARKSAGVLRGGSVRLESHNISTLKDAEFAALVAAFQDELKQRGILVSQSETGTKIALTISGSLTSFVAVSKIDRGGSEEVFLEQLGRAIDAAPTDDVSTLSVHEEFLFAQDLPMADVLVGDDNKSALVVLGLREINTYAWKDGRWDLAKPSEAVHQVASQKELRGFLYFDEAGGTAYFPGEMCVQSSASGAGLNCQSYRGPMRVRGVSLDLLSKMKMAAWYSVAEVEGDGRTRLVATGRDGATRLYDGGVDPVVLSREWGSELAVVHSGCGTGTQILVTSKGDWTNPDSVRVIQIQNGAAREVSSPMEFPGPIIALHTAATGTAESGLANKSAVAIVRNLQTGRYEAYRLTISCGN
jgi:hypothetical protein